MSSRNALPKDFAHVIDCIKWGLVKPLDFISHRVHLNEFKDQFKILSGDQSVIKAVIDFD